VRARDEGEQPGGIARREAVEGDAAAYRAVHRRQPAFLAQLDRTWTARRKSMSTAISPSADPMAHSSAPDQGASILASTRRPLPACKGFYPRTRYG
jgi:hypothetical protein